MKIEKLQKHHFTYLKKFNSGNIVLDYFIKSEQALDANQGVTYVLLNDSNFVIGFYNLLVGRVDSFYSSDQQIYYAPMGGSFEIHYLAVDVSHQHTLINKDNKDSHFYYGDYLLQDCENRILKLREQVGAAFIVIHSTPEGYHMYHDRNDYEDFEEDMSSFAQGSDKSCYKLYKCVDDLVF